MTVASALPLGRGPRRREASLSVPVDSAMLPSVILIETASVRETVAAEY
jgi:hypothetical protein